MKAQPPEPTVSAARAAAPDAAVHATPNAWLSALADGQAQAADAGCAAWRSDGDARRAWHTYHLIGDVMRSAELVSVPTHDLAFLNGVRARLAVEPVVLAPPVRHRWLVPVAAAAGFAMVAGVLLVSGVGLPGAAQRGDGFASAIPAAGPGEQLVRAPLPVVATALQAEELLVRNAQLDAYLRAHEAARGGMAARGGLRRLEVAVPASADR